MRVFIIEDDDTGECHVFKNRNNAINAMYQKCEAWGAIIYVPVKVHGFYQYVSLDTAFDTKEQKLDFLYGCNAKDLCDIFEAYWYFQECDIEDEEE